MTFDDEELAYYRKRDGVIPPKVWKHRCEQCQRGLSDIAPYRETFARRMCSTCFSWEIRWARSDSEREDASRHGAIARHPAGKGKKW